MSPSNLNSYSLHLLSTHLIYHPGFFSFYLSFRTTINDMSSFPLSLALAVDPSMSTLGLADPSAHSAILQTLKEHQQIFGISSMPPSSTSLLGNVMNLIVISQQLFKSFSRHSAPTSSIVDIYGSDKFFSFTSQERQGTSAQAEEGVQ